MKQSTHQSVCATSAWRVAMATLGFAFFLFAISTIYFYLGRSLNDTILPIALICSIVLTAIIGTLRHSDNHTGWIAVTLLIIIGGLFLCTYVYDTSYDGMRYHQEIVASILSGWNPVTGEMGEGVSPGLWSRHYAKGIEICEAAISAFTGRIESGKGINLILIAGAISGVYAFLRENPKRYFIGTCQGSRAPGGNGFALTKGESSETAGEGGNGFARWKSFVGALVIVGSPIVWAQCLSFYIDFYKYIFLLYVLLGIVLIGGSEQAVRSKVVRNVGNSQPMARSNGVGTAGDKDAVARWRGYAILFFALILAMATKFNFFFEAGLWMIAAFVWAAVKRDWIALRRLFLVSMIALMVGFGLCWHPYFTNWSGFGHPLYPLMGEGAVDIMSKNTPAAYLGGDRFTNFIRSLITVSMPSVDQREGGFTILMPLILLCSLWIAWRLRRKLRGVIWYVAGMTLLSCFMYEQSWWSRYICQLWLFCSIFLVASQCVKQRAIKSGFVLAVLMGVAGGAALTLSVARGVIKGGELDRLLEVSKEERVTVSGHFPVEVRKHFDERRVKYIYRDSITTEMEKNAVEYSKEYPLRVILSDAQLEHLRQ